MKRWLVAGAIVALIASSAAAQQVMDGSEQKLDPEDRKLVLKMVTRGFFDPASSQFYSLGYQIAQGKIEKKTVCGYVNAKNRMGGYVGIEPFFYNTETSEVTFLPTELKPQATETFFQFVEALGCPRP